MQHQSLLIIPGRHFVGRGVSAERAVVVIVGVLLSGLADSARVGAEGQAALNKALVGMHFQEVEAVREIVQALQCAEQLRILFRLPAGVADRVETVQLVEAAAAARDELPGLDA